MKIQQFDLRPQGMSNEFYNVYSFSYKDESYMYHICKDLTRYFSRKSQETVIVTLDNEQKPFAMGHLCDS